MALAAAGGAVPENVLRQLGLGFRHGVRVGGVLPPAVKGVLALVERVVMLLVVQAVVMCVQFVAVVVEVLSRAGRSLTSLL